MEGKIILITFPQDNEQKSRPALVLRVFPKHGDLLVCGISSKLHQYIPNFDLLLDEKHIDFEKSGLKAAGVCRLNFLTMVRRDEIRGAIGEISDMALDKLLTNLSHYLMNRDM